MQLKSQVQIISVSIAEETIFYEYNINNSMNTLAYKLAALVVVYISVFTCIVYDIVYTLRIIIIINWPSTMAVPTSLHFSDKVYCTKVTVEMFKLYISLSEKCKEVGTAIVLMPVNYRIILYYFVRVLFGTVIPTAFITQLFCFNT